MSDRHGDTFDNLSITVSNSSGPAWSSSEWFDTVVKNVGADCSGAWDSRQVAVGPYDSSGLYQSHPMKPWGGGPWDSGKQANPWGDGKLNPWGDGSEHAFDPCGLTGHVVDPYFECEYVDGLFVTLCSRCGTKITIDRIPGGSSKAAATTALQALRDGDDERCLELLLLLATEIEAEQEALDEAKELADTLREKMRERLSAGVSS